MSPIKDTVKDIAIRMALSAKTPKERKARIVYLAMKNIIGKSTAFWLINSNGLRGE